MFRNCCVSLTSLHSFSLVRVLGLLSFLGLASLAHAQGIVTDSVASYKPVFLGGTVASDPARDLQTGIFNADLVGDANRPMAYIAFDPGSPGSLTDGTFYFRIRLNAADQAGAFSNNLFIGLDVSDTLPTNPNGGPDGNLNLFLMVNNQGGTKTLEIYAPGDNVNTSPSTTSISSTFPTFTGSGSLPTPPSVAQTSTNYNFQQVSSALDPSINTHGTFSTATNGTPDPDYFLTFGFAMGDIVTGFNRVNLAGFNENTKFALVIATATQSNSFNQDIGGTSGNTSSTATFSSLGAISPETTAGISAVPEPSSLGLLALLGLPGGVLTLARKKR